MAYESNSIFWIEVEKIVPNPFQPRREFDEAKLRELADSIRMYGVLQPLVVTRKEIMREDGAFSSEYELIAGERRLRASKLAGLTQVPVIIRSGEETELMKLELAIIENLQREDLNPVDRALAFRQLSDAFGLSHGQVAQKVGRSREYVSNSIRLLQLPETILSALRVNDISDGHARTLLMLNDRPEEQDIVFREILLKKLSVREVERISRKIATDKVRKRDSQTFDLELIALERQFTETLGTRVQIAKTEYGGRLTIDYFSEDDLRKLLELVHNNDEHTKVLGANTQRNSELDAIQNATPLVPVAEATTLSPEPEAELEPVAEPIPQSVMEASGSEPLYTTQSDEEVFTRFDSIEAPVATPEELSETVVSSEEPKVEVENEIPTESVPPVSHTENIDTPSQAVVAEPEDSNLYSIKNFSL